MDFKCCFCGKTIFGTTQGTRIIVKKLQGSKTVQELYCHIDCLEKLLIDPKMLYLKML